jgi:hypothetical protein
MNEANKRQPIKEVRTGANSSNRATSLEIRFTMTPVLDPEFCSRFTSIDNSLS